MREDRAMAAVRVTGLDHVVLNVRDVERSLQFYVEQLGLQPEQVEEWRRGEAFFPSVRIDEGTILDLLATERSGQNVDHLCVVIEPTDLEELKATGGFDVVEGPLPRNGARGIGTSLYVRDPDDNTVELRCYG
jgi:catechol 2,3-dioxygenase-like lactoylglutathione lyase family enzyme